MTRTSTGWLSQRKSPFQVLKKHEIALARKIKQKAVGMMDKIGGHKKYSDKMNKRYLDMQKKDEEYRQKNP